MVKKKTHIKQTNVSMYLSRFFGAPPPCFDLCGVTISDSAGSGPSTVRSTLSKCLPEYLQAPFQVGVSKIVVPQNGW